MNMLFLVCILAIWLRSENCIDISWWILIPGLTITAMMGILEGILIYKEIKETLREKEMSHKSF
ncbi:hypothetical protein D920_00069 [Enterococcus faecalis 13-SD-W-01]|nr:hypothetical protein D920_00069 [Enterococcus faecalis 13-SD-W-01]